MREERRSRRRPANVSTFLPSTYGILPSMRFSRGILLLMVAAFHFQLSVRHHEQEMVHGCSVSNSGVWFGESADSVRRSAKG
jgi:hypothetical protein